MSEHKPSLRLSNRVYGQFCPLAMAAEFLCNRWTLLILRELLFGSTTFNDISRGVPRMSRSLLSSRLKTLIQAGIVIRSDTGQQPVQYHLTEAGKALKTVVLDMAIWGQTWLKIEPSLEDLDAGLLMWDIRRNTLPIDGLPNPFVVEFHLTDVAEKLCHYWLVYTNGEVDLCHVDHGFEPDVFIEVSADTLTRVWMGWETLDDAIARGNLLLKGERRYTRTAARWLGHSSVAHIAKVAAERRI